MKNIDIFDQIRYNKWKYFWRNIPPYIWDTINDNIFNSILMAAGSIDDNISFAISIAIRNKRGKL